jgi:hypothetical protein
MSTPSKRDLRSDERLARARFDAAAKSRIVVDLDAAVAMLAETIAALRKTIATEERRSKVNDPALPAYSLVAKDAALRSQKLQATVVVLTTRLRHAIFDRDDAIAHVASLEAIRPPSFHAKSPASPSTSTKSTTQ